ncbi:MAG: acyl-coenzyme A thioesterase PaaI-like protein, partial [Pseudomonas sp.]
MALSQEGMLLSTLTAEQVQVLIRLGVPMADDMDLCIDHLDVEKAVARVPFHGKLVRPGGTLSGPVIMALADAAMYA